MAGEGEGRKGEEGTVFERPCREGGDEAGVVKRVIGFGFQRRWLRRRREIGGGEEERGVLSAEVE